MNTRTIGIKIMLAGLAIVLALAMIAGQAGVTWPAIAQEKGQPRPQATPYSTAFTYQGQLKLGGSPVNGVCDFQFGLWDAPNGGNLVGFQEVPNVKLAEGLFTARLDFGQPAQAGVASWLDIALCCPAGSGTCTALSPRQELTAAPAALALVLPFSAVASSNTGLLGLANSGTGAALELASESGPALRISSAGTEGVNVVAAGASGVSVSAAGADGIFVHQAGVSPGPVTSSGHHGVEVAGAEGNGLYVGAAGASGVHVQSTAGSGIYVASAAVHGYQLESANYNGLNVDHAGSDGMYVGTAGNSGVNVSQVGADGVFVGAAGTPSSSQVDPASNGFEVAGTEGSGLWVGRADGDGVSVNSAGLDGVRVISSGQAGVHVHAAGTGVHVESATESGMRVDAAGQHGIVVGNVGTPPSSQPSALKNGFEVAGTEGAGLYVGIAGTDGVYVVGAVDNGVEASGNNYAGVFWGNIYVSGNCTGCTLAHFGRNDSSRPLVPGDIVAVQGMVTTTLDNAPRLLSVVPADGTGTAIGVVSGRVEVEIRTDREAVREGETGRRLVPSGAVAGAAQPGEYVAIVVSGPIQVRAATGTATMIQPGARLAVGAGGLVRPLETVVVDGVALGESAPLLGIALEAPDAEGWVWVLVNPQ